jgi:arylsulfatase A-like enzyme
MKNLSRSTLLFPICFLLLSRAPAQRTPHVPNVIFILADDLGYGDLGCYGQQLIATPNIDKLAGRGIRFSQFYAGTAVCAPSRSSLLTGQHTGHTPIRGNYAVGPEGQLPLPDSTYTIAKLFKRAGYATGDFGKWGLGFIGSTGDPLRQGFDKFYGYNCQTLAHNYFPDHLWENDTKVNLPNTLTDQPVYAGDLIQASALKFIDDNKTRPFFIYLSYTLPHASLQLPAGDSLLEFYKKKFNEQPKPVKHWDGKGYQPQAYPHAAYAAMVAKLDIYVGQVVEKLKALHLDQNTLIIFTSDNGPHAEGGNDPFYFNSGGGFRGIKRDLYEGGIREPMIITWPAVIKAGQESHQTGAFWDFLPTFADILDVPVPAHTDGISVLPTLEAKGSQKQHDYFYWEFHENNGREAIRMGNWKGVRYNVNNNKNTAWELYDLARDPHETTNLAMQHPELVNKFNELAAASHTPSSIPEWNF